MPRKSFDSVIGKAELMMQALRSNADEAAKYSVGAEDLDLSESRISLAKKENARQEKLKSDLKESTEKVRTALEEIENDFSRYKKIVKLAFPHARWKEFGMDDKQ